MQAVSSFIIEPIGISVDAVPRPIDFTTLYGNANSVELEIGMGKGTFILDQARARPATNFFGIEWANWYWRYCSDRLRRAGCMNTRTARVEAHFFLRECLAAESLDVIHIYFPDPWPKAKQNKRRLIQPPFLQQVMRVLKPGGELRVVTDHEGYWRENVQPFVSSTPGLTPIEYARPASAGADEVVGTNFERKYILEGRPFYSIAGRKAATNGD